MSKKSRPENWLPCQPINTGLINLNEVYAQRDKLALRDYQNQHLGFFLTEHRALDRSDAGTGKTPVMCLWVYAMSKDKRVIWTMPKSLLVKNYEELLLWSGLTPDQITLVDGTADQRKQQLSRRSTRVWLMGFDAFTRSWRDMVASYPDLYHLCGDEWHLGFANHGEADFRRPGQVYGTKRTYEMYQYMRRGGAFLGGTGTLIDGKLTSAFPSLRLIDPRYYPTLDNFLSWHAVLDGYGNPYVWKNHDRLRLLLDKHSRRVTFEDAYGKEAVLPPQVVRCTMSDKQRSAYAQMEAMAVAELDRIVAGGERLEAANDAVATKRCLEMMQVPEKYGLPANPSDGKDAHLETYIEKALAEGEPLIIFEPVVQAHPRIKAMVERLGGVAGVMNGDVSSTERQRLDVEFRRGHVNVMICSPKVAGIGYNWGHVNTVIFASLDYKDTTFIQAYRRAVRGVRTSLLRILILQYRSSLDQKIAGIVNERSKMRLKVETGTAVRIVQHYDDPFTMEGL